MGRQFLNCEIDTCWIVFLTIQELSKAQGNNTDINNTEYSNTDPILSGDKEVSILVDTVEQTV